jgi:hypothetical protein
MVRKSFRFGSLEGPRADPRKASTGAQAAESPLSDRFGSCVHRAFDLSSAAMGEAPRIGGRRDCGGRIGLQG